MIARIFAWTRDGDGRAIEKRKWSRAECVLARCQKNLAESKFPPIADEDEEESGDEAEQEGEDEEEEEEEEEEDEQMGEEDAFGGLSGEYFVII